MYFKYICFYLSDRSTLVSSEGSWSSVLAQINNLINPLKGIHNKYLFVHYLDVS